MAQTSTRDRTRLAMPVTRTLIALLMGAWASAAWSAPLAEVEVRELLRSATTTSGKPIVLPEGPVEAVVARYTIAPHATLAVHKHPYVRLGYILSGSLEVTNVETHRSRVFKTGEAIVEDIGQWHAARNLETRPAELLVIDLAPPKAATTERRD